MHGLTLRTYDVREWYRLSYAYDPPGLRVAVHPVAVAQFLKESQTVYAQSWYRTIEPAAAAKVGLPPLILPSWKDPWGFGTVLQPNAMNDGWLCWSCLFPRIGFDDPEPDWKVACATAASLAELFEGLNAVNAPVVSPRWQACAVSLSCRFEVSCYGFTIGATVSGRWARQLGESLRESAREREVVHHVTRAMRKAYLAMGGGASAHLLAQECGFRFAEPFHVFFEAPGNACGLGYEYASYNNYPSGGYALNPHNTDGPHQQLTLLAGLAALNDAVSPR